jgi:cob(I)alamin adenosyltransferase
MSIVTKTGDHGETGLMYNRRVSKNHPRIQACGAVDELNSALGLARATAEDARVRDGIESFQKNLVALMGELATAAEDLERYARDGYALLTKEHTGRVEKWIAELEAQKISFQGWATPGATVHSAALDVARSVCRRAERLVCELQSAGQLQNPEIMIFLNRLSDLLWLLARSAESQVGGGKS